MANPPTKQQVKAFLLAALECSFYVAPEAPGLTHDELFEVGRRLNLQPGEMNDVLSEVADVYMGMRADERLLPSRDGSLIHWQYFIQKEEPEYRDIAAFDHVYLAWRDSARANGAGNVRLERRMLVEQATKDGIARDSILTAIAILVFTEVLQDNNGILQPKTLAGDITIPSDNVRQNNIPQTRRDPARAAAYPIVKNIVEHRTHSRPQKPGEANHNSRMQEAGLPVCPEMPSKEEWISAASAVSLVSLHSHLATRAICKRAYVGLISARAERVIHGGHSVDNVDVPAEFWWAGGEAALEQNWTSGDFETWFDNRIQMRVFGVTFRRSDIERMRPMRTVEHTPSQALVPAKELEKGQRMAAAGKTVFIGHGRSPAWRELKDFFQERLHLTVDEFNSVPTAGVPTAVRLAEMLDNAAFAFLILTAEDEQSNGAVHARLNVVHETGLFQGKLGFKKAIILLEDGCEEFSNIDGLGQIRFPKGNVSAKFEEIRHVLERESIIQERTRS